MKFNNTFHCWCCWVLKPNCQGSATSVKTGSEIIGLNNIITNSIFLVKFKVIFTLTFFNNRDFFIKNFLVPCFKNSIIAIPSILTMNYLRFSISVKN